MNDVEKRIGYSVMVFSGLSSLLCPSLKIIKRNINDDDTKHIISNYILILISSFIDEYKNKFCKIGDNSTIETTKICKILFLEIEKWPGIKKFRNTSLAHPFRTKAPDNSVFDIVSFLNKGTVPMQYAQTIFLGECAAYICGIIIRRHSEKRDLVLKEYMKEFSYKSENEIKKKKIFLIELTQ